MAKKRGGENDKKGLKSGKIPEKEKNRGLEKNEKGRFFGFWGVEGVGRIVQDVG
jgi:hypothetical protein